MSNTPVSPKLNPVSASRDNNYQKSFLEGPTGELEPSAAPKLSRTPGLNSENSADVEFPDAGEHSVQVLRQLGVPSARIQTLLKSGIVGSSVEEDYEDEDTTSRSRL